MFRVWPRVLGLCDKTVLENVEFDEVEQVGVAHVRPRNPATRTADRTGGPSAAPGPLEPASDRLVTEPGGGLRARGTGPAVP